jgi:hypothetical protein
MSSMEGRPLVLAVKDPDKERPIPTAWRSTIKAIVHALAVRDYQLDSGVSGVAPASAETANHIKKYVESYGAELIELPDEAWDTSVCIWTGSRWDALIDLWSASEGRTDLVLSLQVQESAAGIEFHIYMVYVP